jgi:putative membrane protein
LDKAASPGVTWLVFITVYIGWHDSTAYNTALIYSWVHDIQHITFFGAALLYWWPIVGAAPRVHGQFPGWGKLAYLIGTIPPNMFIGVSIAFASEVLYSYYLSVPRIWGVTVMQDQQLSGAIMWIPGSMMFLVAALIILARMFGREKRPEDLERAWDNEATMIAPGLEDRVVQNRWRRLQATEAQDQTPVETRVDVTQHV